jgi:hypothetical protein
MLIIIYNAINKLSNVQKKKKDTNQFKYIRMINPIWYVIKKEMNMVVQNS